MVIYPPKARDTVRALHTKFGVSFATPWLRRGTNLKMLTTSLRPLFVGAHQIALFHSTHSTAYIYIPIAASSCSRVSSFSWRPSSLPLTHARAFATSLPTSSYSARVDCLPLGALMKTKEPSEHPRFPLLSGRVVESSVFLCSFCDIPILCIYRYRFWIF